MTCFSVFLSRSPPLSSSFFLLFFLALSSLPSVSLLWLLLCCSVCLRPSCLVDFLFLVLTMIVQWTSWIWQNCRLGSQTLAGGWKLVLSLVSHKNWRLLRREVGQGPRQTEALSRSRALRYLLPGLQRYRTGTYSGQSAPRLRAAWPHTSLPNQAWLRTTRSQRQGHQ
jgi:hypothetical protein